MDLEHAFLDADLDGYQDLILTTGHAYDAMDADAQMRAQRSRRLWREQLLDFPDLDLPNMAFRNLGEGTFAMQPDGWGLGLEADVAHGLATGDFDQDGDLDVVISRLNDRVGLFRNNAKAPRVGVRLAGLPPNMQGIGAKLRLVAPEAPLQQQEITAGGNYLSSSEPMASFAWFAGAQLEVRWRSGQVSSIENLQPGHLYEVQEANAIDSQLPEAPPEPMFAAQPLELVHWERPYEDFERQPLLHRRLSQRGPALMAADLDGNGDDDLLLGSGKGGRLQYALNFGGHFGRPQTLGDPAAGDHAGVLVFPSVNGSEPVVAATISNYERTPEQAGDAAWMEVLGLRTREVRQRIMIGTDTPGPIVLADFTGDGELELFIGGHFGPGRFPEAATSRLYRRESGTWQPDETLSAPFAALGLISGATATDVNQDGLADLALADALGPVRVFVNRGNGELVEMTRTLGLGDHTGWWNGVATGDFDADGRLDLIATNSGLNLHYEGPVRWYYGDMDGSGTVEIIETQPAPGGYGFVRDLPTMLNAIPPLAQRVSSYSHFASLTVDQVMGSALQNMARKDMETGAVMVFFNRGQEFKAIPLADAAQLSMAYGAVVADCDGDGFEDVFLSQNEFALPPSTPRLDSGLGIMLLGSASGHLVPAGPVRSGIRVYGAQRAAVAADFDGDHRTDLAIAQNAGPVRWYRNMTGGIGMRVRLAGPPGNPKAVGASVRLEYADSTLGPVRLVTAGSGYWSQSSMTQLLGINRQVAHVRVRWPDGEESRVPVEDDDIRRVRIAYAQ